MWDFFKGWQRKVGVATLGLACVMAAWWVMGVSYPAEIKHGSFVINNREHEVEVAFQTGGSRKTIFGLFYPPVVIILTLVAARLVLPNAPPPKSPESP